MQEGRYETALVDEETRIYGFWRYTKEQKLLVLLNTSGQEQKIELPEGTRRYIDVENGMECQKKEIIIPKGSGKVFQCRKD